MLVRYKQTVIGVAWALIRPVLTMLVFVAFRRMTRISGSSVPEAILVFSAVLPWQFFSTALSEASMSLVGNSNLISKVYFPRILIPFASVVTSLVDFGIMLALLCLLMAWYWFMPGWQIFAMPLLILLTLLLATGTGLLLAALTIEYRDFRYIVPFIVQFGLFVSPIAIETDKVPAKWHLVFIMNPMAGIIDGFRWAVQRGQGHLDLLASTFSVGFTILFLALGVWYFRRTERTFADVI